MSPPTIDDDILPSRTRSPPVVVVRISTRVEIAMGRMPAEPTPSVAQLLEQARNGDTDARNRLFEMCRSYVAISAKAEMASWLQAKVDASDLVQQSLLEAHRGLDNFRGQTEAEWLGWLRKIVAHNAADFVRRFHGVEKRKASREVSLQPGDDSEMGLQLSDGGDSPSKILIQKESELQIADAIAQLSEDYQQVILLRNMRRLPFDEVAREMGRSRPATQMLWMRAVKKLQELLPSTEIPVTRDPP